MHPAFQLGEEEFDLIQIRIVSQNGRKFGRLTLR